LVVFFLIFAPELIGLVYSDTYVPATQAARILIGFSLIQAMADPFYVVSQAAERANLVFYSSLWGFYNLAANILLVPLFGIEGAALATGSAGALMFLYFMGVYQYGIGVRFPFLISTCGTTVINLCPALILFGIAKAAGLLTLWGVGFVLLGGVSYALAARVNRVFETSEWELIQRRLSGIPVVKTLV
jgi:O-antigen/teichoic acid export membrane protein